MDTKKIIADMKKNGAKVTKDVAILTATVTPSETIDGLARVSLNTNGQFDFLHTDEDGTETITKTGIVLSSNYAIIGILRTNEFAAPVIGELQMKPAMLSVILAGATMTVVSETVEKDTDYINPFTTRTDATPTTFDHKVIINHVVDIKLSKRAEARLDRMTDKVLGL